ncbi:MAG TPA: hypothetical protein VKZ63_17885, partial [Kofleriaceae bacterium]|nr:hypothetical protein [Kofleriaceae bacterium]
IQGRQDGTPIDSEGTWTEESGQVFVSFPYEDANVNLHLDALPDRALGGPLYQRVSAAARNDRQNR